MGPQEGRAMNGKKSNLIQAWLSGIGKHNIKGDKEYERGEGQREASGRRGKERGGRGLKRRRKEEREKRKRR